jgi:MFS family permease
MSAATDRWFVSALIGGTLPAVFSYVAIGVAVPQLEAQFGVGQSGVHWAATSFIAAMMGGMLSASALLSRIGLPASLRASALVFSAASAAAALAADFWTLVVARFVMGLAGGLGQPLALVVLYRSFGPQQRGRATALFGVATAICSSIAALVAGVLVDMFDWRAIFWAPIPLSMAFLLAARRAPTHDYGRAHGLDVPGLVALYVALLAVLGMDFRDGLTDAHSLLAMALLAASATVVALRQRRAVEPLFHRDLFCHWGYVMAAACATLYGALMFGLAYLLPIYLQLGLQLSPSSAGAWLVLPGVALVVAIQVGGPLTDRASFRPVLLVGFGLMAVGAGALGWPMGAAALWFVILWSTVARAGMGFVYCGINTGATRTVPDALLPHVPGSTNFFRFLGGAIGVRLVAVVLDGHRPPSGAAFGASFLLLSALALLALPMAARMQARPTDAGVVR